MHPLLIPEILFRIFSNTTLSKHDLATCSLVCQQWYSIAQLCLWQQLDLDQEGTSQHRELFSSRSRRNALVDQLATHGHLVRTLTIPDCRSDMGFLRQMARRMPRLETIAVNRVALSHYLSVLTQLVGPLPEEDDTVDEHQSPPSQLEETEGQSSSAIRTLRSLCLPHVTEDGGGTAMLLQLCKQNAELRHLNLVDSELDDAALAKIAQYCPKLKSLDLSRSENLTLDDELFDGDVADDTEDDDNDNKEEHGMCFCCYYQEHRHRDQGTMALCSARLQQRQGHAVGPVTDHLHLQQQNQKGLEYSQEYHCPYSSRLSTQTGYDTFSFFDNAEGIWRENQEEEEANRCAIRRAHTEGAAQQQHHHQQQLTREPKNGGEGSSRHRASECCCLQQTKATNTTTTTVSHNSASSPSGITPSSPTRVLCSASSTSTRHCRSCGHVPFVQGCTITSSPVEIVPSRSPLQRPKRPHQRPPRFSRLEHVSLVFCLGISNHGFQRLFNSLYGLHALRSVNLEFTLIQDSGLLTLARACGGGFYQGNDQPQERTEDDAASPASFFGSGGLTSVCVNYCSQITHKGIRALIDHCPRLEELEFVGCDGVSAQVFEDPTRPQRPWRCIGLKRLVFTLQPTVLMGGSGGDRDDEASVIQTESPSATHVALMETMGMEGGLPTLPSMEGLSSTSDEVPIPSLAPVLGGCATAEEDKAAQGQQEQRKAIMQDYWAMFRQLKRLTRLESLHMYNSPAVNAHLPCVDEDVEMANVADTAAYVGAHTHYRRQTGRGQDQQQKQQRQHSAHQKDVKQQKKPVHNNSESCGAKDKCPASRRELTTSTIASGSSYDDAGEGSSRRTSLDVPSAPSSSSSVSSLYPLFVDDEDASLNDNDMSSLCGTLPFEDAIIEPSGTPSIIAVDEEEDGTQEGQEQAESVNTVLHPFTFHAGLKALGHLKRLQSLMLYERATVVLGVKELKWMGKQFPCLRTVQLKGAIYPHADAVQALAVSRPRLDVQVCRLFEEQSL